MTTENNYKIKLADYNNWPTASFDAEKISNKVILNINNLKTAIINSITGEECNLINSRKVRESKALDSLFTLENMFF